MSDFISEQLVILANIARILNGTLGYEAGDKLLRAFGPKPPIREEWVTEEQAARAHAIAVVEATVGTKYPGVPAAAAKAYDELSAGQSVELTAHRIHLGGPWVLRPDHRTPIHLVSQSARGHIAVWLLFYFMNPQRERLRPCQQCSRWFVDMTRNKSSRRCSRACTIAWSNAQRKEASS